LVPKLSSLWKQHSLHSFSLIAEVGSSNVRKSGNSPSCAFRETKHEPEGWRRFLKITALSALLTVFFSQLPLAPSGTLAFLREPCRVNMFAFNACCSLFAYGCLLLFKSLWDEDIMPGL
jgi:hypothetical protein